MAWYAVLIVLIFTRRLNPSFVVRRVQTGVELCVAVEGIQRWNDSQQRWRRHAKESGGDTDALLPIRVESTPSRPPCDPCDAEGGESNMSVFQTNMSVFQTSKVAAEVAITRYIIIYDIYIFFSL